MTQKKQLTEEDIIMKAFANMMNKKEHDEYWDILTSAFAAFAMTMEELYLNEDSSPILFQDTLEKFVAEVSRKKEVADAMFNVKDLVQSIIDGSTK